MCRDGTAAAEDPRTRLGSPAAKQGLSCPEACGIFLYQGLNRITCIGRRSLKVHWTTREVPLVTDLRMNSTTPTLYFLRSSPII